MERNESGIKGENLVLLCARLYVEQKKQVIKWRRFSWTGALNIGDIKETKAMTEDYNW